MIGGRHSRRGHSYPSNGPPTGQMLRCCLLPSFTEVSIFVSGCSQPSQARDNGESFCALACDRQSPF